MPACLYSLEHYTQMYVLTYYSAIKTRHSSWAWWLRPIIPAMLEIKAGKSKVHSISGLQTEFKDNLSKLVRSCFKTKSKKKARQSRKDISVVESTCWLSRRPKFGSQHRWLTTTCDSSSRELSTLF